MPTSSRIKAYRESRGYSQEYMATSLNISQELYSKMESGSIKLEFESIAKIATLLKVEIYYLMC